MKKIAPHFREREALLFMDILEKSKILIKINKIMSNGVQPKRRRFKIFINPHIHLWLLDKKFTELPTNIKGHIIESYWLFWAISISKFDKQFYYLKDKNNYEIDFVSLIPSSGKFKTLHEMKWTYSNKSSLHLMKSIDAINKIIWNIDGSYVHGIQGKSILDTFNKPI